MRLVTRRSGHRRHWIASLPIVNNALYFSVKYLMISQMSILTLGGVSDVQAIGAVRNRRGLSRLGRGAGAGREVRTGFHQSGPGCPLVCLAGPRLLQGSRDER